MCAIRHHMLYACVHIWKKNKGHIHISSFSIYATRHTYTHALDNVADFEIVDQFWFCIFLLNIQAFPSWFRERARLRDHCPIVSCAFVLFCFRPRYIMIGILLFGARLNRSEIIFTCMMH